MPKAQFDFMREVLAAPSPVGLEAAMSYGVLKPAFEKWMPKSWEIHGKSLTKDTRAGARMTAECER